LRVLRRVLRLAVEWGVIENAPKIKLLRGAAHRERVITPQEETKYLAASPQPLCSIATILADTGLRPDECYSLRWEYVSFENGRYGTLLVTKGKTPAARRTLPLTRRVRGVFEALHQNSANPDEGWVFPAPTKTGHADHSTVKKQHIKTLKLSNVRYFVLYSLRHTFLTRLAENGCDAWTLARIAGWSNISMSMRYVHPSEDSVLKAMSQLPAVESQEIRSLPQ
jgi:integrase